MDTETALAVAAGIGLKETAEKVLGPTASYLGDGLKHWTERGFQNVSRIFQSASKFLGSKIDEPGVVPPRVLKEVLAEGPFCEDEVLTEYFGGVLASSRSGISRDDRGARLTALVARLSTYQIRTHYVIYRIVRELFADSPHQVGAPDGRRSLRVLFPLNALASSLELAADENFIPILEHSIFGLHAEGLIEDEFMWAGPEELLSQLNVKAEVSSLVVAPSPLGCELFMWAHGVGGASLGRFLARDLRIVSQVNLTVGRGIRGASEQGPRLEDVLNRRGTPSS